MKSHIVVLDPAVQRPELEIFNDLVSLSSLPLTHHFPALFGLGSLKYETEGVKGVIILGSASSVNDRLPWQEPLEKWVAGLLEKRIPALGLCYGHQMIAYMHGSKVAYLSPDKHKELGFRKVELKPNILWGNQPLEGKLIVSHKEEVKTCPNSFLCVGSSPKVSYEALTHASLPIWTFQAHPEANRTFMHHRSMPELPTESDFTFGKKLMRAFLDYVAIHRD